jgi:TolA-binding protein
MAGNYPKGSDRLLDDMLKQDVTAPQGLFERCEARLFGRISRESSAEPWELYLKKDVPPAPLDETEKKLFKRIQPRPALLFLSLFSTTAFSLMRNKKVVAGVVGAAFLCCVLAGVGYFSETNRSVDSVLLDIQPGRPSPRQMVASESETLRTGPGQRLVLSNCRARILVENGATCTLQKTKKSCMVYSVGFKDSEKNRQARVVFFVTKLKSTEQFTVETKGYSIAVVGTAFGVFPGPQGHITTKVYEGTIRISTPGGETSVSSGKGFAYDARSSGYTVMDIDTMRKYDGAALHEPSAPAGEKQPVFSSSHTSKKPVTPRDSLLERAIRLETDDWKKAIDCYGTIMEVKGCSEYEREIALFSMARLHADNDTAATEARTAFESYLKQFPRGNFTGESYMRLAELEFKNNPGRSLFWYLRYLREFPATQNSAGAEYRAGLIYLQNGERTKAIEMLSSALSHAKHYPADKVAAIRRTLDNAKNPQSDSGNITNRR